MTRFTSKTLTRVEMAANWYMPREFGSDRVTGWTFRIGTAHDHCLDCFPSAAGFWLMIGTSNERPNRSLYPIVSFRISTNTGSPARYLTLFVSTGVFGVYRVT